VNTQHLIIEFILKDIKIICATVLVTMSQELQFKVLIEVDEQGLYIATVPELPGCYTQGKTLEEARERIKEAIELILESDKEKKKRNLNPRNLLHIFLE